MAPYVAIFSRPGDIEGRRQVCAVSRALCADRGWTLKLEHPGLRLFQRSGRELQIRSLEGGRGLVIGSLFHACGTPAATRILDADLSSPAAAATHISSHFWGRYVALLTTPSGGLEGVFRDPSGAVECVNFSGAAGLTIVASHLPDALLKTAGAQIGIDWETVRSQLADPSLMATACALHGVEALAPGELLQPLAAVHRRLQIWRPTTFARAPAPLAASARAQLRDVVEGCVAALADSAGPILAEVSGGLDSSIVASVLAARSAHVCGWVNYVTADPAGDERAYARAVALTLGIDVEETPKPPFTIMAETITEAPQGLRPSINALDSQYDADQAEKASARGAQAIFTGQGGDAVFFQPPSPLIFADRVRRLGLSAFFGPTLGELSRWTRRSAWALGWIALTGGSHRAALKEGLPAWICADPAGSLPLHPWLQDTADLPPAKRMHIEELAHTLLFNGASRRGRQVELIHPLLAQPVMELCLSLPVDMLVEGGRDRGLAREAFRDRLPSLVVDRRSKGELGAFYGRGVAAGLPGLRAYLLDGRLVAKGLVDARALDAAMSEDQLALSGGYGDILRAVALEGWVRDWESRLVRCADGLDA